MNFEVVHASFGYKKEPDILKDIHFQIGKGEILSILGSNGVGKTTLLKCTLGFLPWRSGETRIDGKKWSEWKNQDIWKRIGYVPQAKRAAFSYTTEEMVLLGRNAHLGILSQPSKKDEEHAKECLEMVGMSRLIGKLCNEISGGELQMVLIARALATDPELLILDEPESNLDFKNQLIVIHTIRDLCKERGISSIVNTHYPEHALAISHKALILNRDGTNAFGPASDIINEERLGKAFDVDVRIRSFHVAEQKHTCVLPIDILRSDRKASGERELRIHTGGETDDPLMDIKIKKIQNHKKKELEKGAV